MKIDYNEFFGNLDVIGINYAFLTFLIFIAALAIFYAIRKSWEIDLVKSVNGIGKVPMAILVTSVVYLGVSTFRMDWGILSICLSILVTLVGYLALILNETLVVQVIFNQWGRLTISRGRDKFLQFVDVKTEEGLFCGLYFDVIMIGPELESMEIKAPIRFSQGDDRSFPYIFPHKGTLNLPAGKISNFFFWSLEDGATVELATKNLSYVIWVIWLIKDRELESRVRLSNASELVFNEEMISLMVRLGVEPRDLGKYVVTNN